MREILFRGTTFKGEWVEGFYMTNSSGETFIQVKDAHSTKDVYPETVGQFTGLLDKNGTRIFEGDIVKRIFVDEHLQEIEQLWEVYWGQWCWMKKKANGIGFSFDSIEARDSEVIGNIHDNPELLSERSVVSGRE